MKLKNLNNKGFTLAELIIAMGIAAIIFASAVSIYSTFFGSIRNIRAANAIYEESNFLMERVLKEVRQDTVDYDEYYNKFSSVDKYPTSQVYGLNTCGYNELFYDKGRDGKYGTDDDTSAGRNIGGTRALTSPTQDQLILINAAGDEKTIIKKIQEDPACVENLAATPPVECVSRVGMLQLDGFDYGLDGDPATNDPGQNDGFIDTWRCKTGYSCTNYPSTTPGAGEGITATSFIPISPKSLDVRELKFIIAPADDPLKAYNEASMQVQPYVTVKIKAKANPSLTSEFKPNQGPDISLESTVTTRLHQEIHRGCFRPQPVATP